MISDHSDPDHGFDSPPDRPPGTPEDAELLRRYVDTASEEAFSQIVFRHAGWVYHACRRGLRDAHLAEDATQAVFLLLARKAVSIRPETHLGGWLYRACRYVLADVSKNRTRYQRRQELARDMSLRRIISSSRGEGRAELEPELSAKLDEAIASLRDNERQTVLMHFYEGLTLGQMAERLGISHDGVKKRVTRALARLRQRLAGKVKGVAPARAAPPAALLVLLLRARGAEAAPPDVAVAAAKAALVPGRSSTTAELIVSGVSRTLVRGSDKLLAALGAALATLVLVGVAVMLPGGARVAAPAQVRGGVASDETSASPRPVAGEPTDGARRVEAAYLPRDAASALPPAPESFGAESYKHPEDDRSARAGTLEARGEALVRVVESSAAAAEPAPGPGATNLIRGRAVAPGGAALPASSSVRLNVAGQAVSNRVVPSGASRAVSRAGDVEREDTQADAAPESPRNKPEREKPRRAPTPTGKPDHRPSDAPARPSKPVDRPAPDVVASRPPAEAPTPPRGVAPRPPSVPEPTREQVFNKPRARPPVFSDPVKPSIYIHPDLDQPMVMIHGGGFMPGDIRDRDGRRPRTRDRRPPHVEALYPAQSFSFDDDDHGHRIGSRGVRVYGHEWGSFDGPDTGHHMAFAPPPLRLHGPGEHRGPPIAHASPMPEPSIALTLAVFACLTLKRPAIRRRHT